VPALVGGAGGGDAARPWDATDARLYWRGVDDGDQTRRDLVALPATAADAAFSESDESPADAAPHRYVAALPPAAGESAGGGDLPVTLFTNLGSVILKKEDDWADFASRALVANVHYAPAFARGADGALELIGALEADGARARALAAAAQNFATRYLCVRARLVFLRRAIVEYNALFTDMPALVEARSFSFHLVNALSS